MVNILIARGLSKTADLKMIEKRIDDMILEAAGQGQAYCVLKISTDKVLSQYEKVLEKYKLYDIHVGKNHDNLHLIRISW